MAASPLITFKAGRCEQSGRSVKPDPTPGYVYLYSDEDLLHFCWRSRDVPSTEPDLDLIMFPSDGSFTPLLREQGTEDLHSPTSGRIYKLAFSSSGQKHYFWMQSQTQHKEGNLSWFSERDQRIGQIIDSMLQGEEVNVEAEMDEFRRGSGGGDDDGDEMELDEDALGRRESHTGGAGADATGGDPRDEGESSREGGADGGRAPQDSTQTAVQNFLQSLGGSNPSQGQQQRQQQSSADIPYTTLPDLLTPQTTIPFLQTATPAQITELCSFLPPELMSGSEESTTGEARSAPAPTTEQQRTILSRVLRSPQLTQSLGSLTSALHDGGLPMIGEALGLKVQNGGNMRGSAMPLGGNRAVEAFVEGVKKTVEDDETKKN